MAADERGGGERGGNAKVAESRQPENASHDHRLARQFIEMICMITEQDRQKYLEILTRSLLE
jgi:hypothetical protein